MVDQTNASRIQVVRHPLKPRRIAVTRVDSIARDYLRVTFAGDDLVDFVTLDPNDHVKLVFPAGDDAAGAPVWDDGGFRWPSGASSVTRDYTPRRFDPERRTLAIDFVLHGDGPATTWARRAAPGQVIGLLGPRGSKIVLGGFDWQLMIGDETALPAIARRLEELPPGARAVAVIEADGPDQAQPLPTAADAEVIWAYRYGAPAGTTTDLEDAVRALAFPPGACFVWAGGEATRLRPIRRHLLAERGIDRVAMSFSGHWKRGVAGHDHHEPIDDGDPRS